MALRSNGLFPAGVVHRGARPPGTCTDWQVSCLSYLFYGALSPASTASYQYARLWLVGCSAMLDCLLLLPDLDLATGPGLAAITLSQTSCCFTLYCKARLLPGMSPPCTTHCVIVLKGNVSCWLACRYVKHVAPLSCPAGGVLAQAGLQALTQNDGASISSSHH